MMVPRPYQEEALAALNLHLREKDTNPVVVIPTGGGKSFIMAWAIRGWKQEYPPFRCIILAHREELVAQNAAELIEIWPEGDIGIYSAGLGRRDDEHSVIFASIDSVYKKWGYFSPWDLIMVDEAHRIPLSGEGKYRAFINGSRISNPNLRVVGMTATPFRMNGPICHKDHLLHEVCYDANVGDLISQGFLCRLRSKVGDVQPDLSDVKRNHNGDYIEESLAAATNIPEVVTKAISSAVGHIIRENRKSIVFFCVDVNHCKQVSMELRKYRIDAPCVTANTPKEERRRIAQQFKDGRLHAICNVNVYTEGFNAKCVDCIVLLRPTLSKGLYVQMVGRGLRLHPSKVDCLILDYAHCIDEHGPIDCIDVGEVKVYECGSCGDIFSRAVRVCPHCGWSIPIQEIERAEAEEREKRLHEEEVSRREILGRQPEECKVDDVSVFRHKKDGAPDSIRVEYRCGLSVFREWVCLDHPGYARQKAMKWWADRFGWGKAADITVDKALEDMFLGQQLANITESITVVRNGKYTEIISHKIIGAT